MEGDQSIGSRFTRWKKAIGLGRKSKKLKQVISNVLKKSPLHRKPPPEVVEIVRETPEQARERIERLKRIMAKEFGERVDSKYDEK